MEIEIDRDSQSPFVIFSGQKEHQDVRLDLEQKAKRLFDRAA